MAGTAQPIGAENGVRRYQLFINGKFTDSRSGKTFESISPHDRSVVAVVAEGDKADIDAAVSAARGAYEGVWSTTPPGERAKLLLKIADLLEANSAELGRLETLDMGMPMVMSSAMGAVSADVFRYWAGMATKLHGLTGDAMRPGNYLGYTLREPLGVVGGITPWNGPLIIAAWKTAPALACGNTVVLKPAENTLMTALELAPLVAAAGPRVLVQEGLYDRFVERFVGRSQQIQVGDPMDFATRMGPLVSEEQLRKVQRYVEIGKKEGARRRCGGGQPKDPALANGFYHEPTVFTEVDNKMQIAQEEIFGPVASVLRFRDEDDAVRIGNDVIYGLAAGVQTKDLKRAHRIAKRLQAGTVWINTWHMIEPNSPFGGYKLSGYGRENGIAMVEHLTRLKQVWVDLNDFTMDLFA